MDASNGQVEVDVDDTYKVIHGILMGTAWLVLAPIAIGASLVRRILPASSSCCHQNGRWFQIHFYCQVLVVVLTIAGFLVIWLGDERDDDDRRRRLASVTKRFLKDYYEDDDDHEEEDYSADENTLMFARLGWTYENAEENIHPKLGMTIVILAVFQAFLGLIRPHVMAHPPTLPAPLKADKKEEDDDDDDNAAAAATSATARVEGEATLKSLEDSAAAESQTDLVVVQVPPPHKTAKRVLWEWCHRCLGLCLLAGAWLQCIIGIKIILS